MKKVLIIFLILLLIASTGVAFFVLTFDADQYRPQAVKKLEEILGRPVDLADISLAWHNGLALEFAGLNIYKDKRGGESLFALESAQGALSLGPLLHKSIQISTIYLERPSIKIIIHPDGRIEGLDQPLQAQGNSGINAAALSFFMEGLKIEKGEVFFRDERGGQIRELTVRDLDLNVRNISLTEPVSFDVRAAVFGFDQDLFLKGNLRVSIAERTAYLENFHLNADLSKMNLVEISKWAPETKSLGDSAVAGTLDADIPSLRLDNSGLREIRGQMRFISPRFVLPGFPHPAENLIAEVSAEGRKITVSKVNAGISGGLLNASGTVNLNAPQPITAFEAKLEDMDLARLQESLPADAARLEGFLSAAFQGTATGLDAFAFQNSLSGIGQIGLRQGVLRNTNILRDVFKKFSTIPGLLQRLEQRLPETYQEKLQARDTYLEDLNVPVSVQPGLVLMNQLDVKTDSFWLRGDARFETLRRFVTARALIAMDAELSKALVESVAEMAALLEQGQYVSIPLTIQGPIEKPAITPDFQAIGSRLAVYKTREVLTDIFQKKNQTQDPNAPQAPADPSQPQSQNGAAQGPSQPRSLLGQLLETALQGSGNSTQGRQTNSQNP